MSMDPGSPYAIPDSELRAEAEVQNSLASMGQLFWTYAIDLVGFLVLQTLVGAVLLQFGRVDSLGGSLLWSTATGKLIMGTRVVRDDGGTPRLAQILGRSLVRLIPFEPFSALNGKFPHPWHDRLSGTRVIRIR
jgi:uncharacterized RDD family membrane protein YckC